VKLARPYGRGDEPLARPKREQGKTASRVVINEELAGLQCGYIYVIIEKGLVIKTKCLILPLVDPVEVILNPLSQRARNE
jgi:hypothetical protein